MDADGSIDPSDLTATIAPLLAGEADLVLRARKPTGGLMSPQIESGLVALVAVVCTLES
jgi:hypothetical protein